MKTRRINFLVLAALAGLAACATAEDPNEGYFVSSVSLPQNCEALYGNQGCCSAAAQAEKKSGATVISCADQKRAVQDALRAGGTAATFDSSCKRTLESYERAGYCEATSSSNKGASGNTGNHSATGNSTSTGSGGGTQACDYTGACSECAKCAAKDACKAELDACNADSDCVDFVSCLNDCSIDWCVDGCVQDYPNGSDLYMPYASCVICDQCPVDCDAVGSGC
jgi:hypothetical protein